MPTEEWGISGPGGGGCCCWLAKLWAQTFNHKPPTPSTLYHCNRCVRLPTLDIDAVVTAHAHRGICLLVAHEPLNRESYEELRRYSPPSPLPKLSTGSASGANVIF